MYRRLDGDNPRIDHIADPDVLATDLAVFIAALQRVDLADGPAAYCGGPLATQDAGTRAALADLRGVVDTEAATAAWDAALRVLEWSGPPVWVEGERVPPTIRSGAAVNRNSQRPAAAHACPRSSRCRSSRGRTPMARCPTRGCRTAVEVWRAEIAFTDWLMAEAPDLDMAGDVEFSGREVRTTVPGHPRPVRP